MTSPERTASSPEQLASAFMPVVCTNPDLDVIEPGPSSAGEKGVGPCAQGIVSVSKLVPSAVVHIECEDPVEDVIKPGPSTSEKAAIPQKIVIVSPFKQNDSASTSAVCKDADRDVTESETSLERENGASIKQSAISHSASHHSDSSVPAPDMDALLPCGSDTVNETSSEEQVSQPEDVQSATSSAKVAQREKEISAFAKAEGLCDPVCGRKTGILISLVGLCLGAMSVPFLVVGEGKRSLIVFVTSLVTIIIGLLLNSDCNVFWCHRRLSRMSTVGLCLFFILFIVLLHVVLLEWPLWFAVTGVTLLPAVIICSAICMYLIWNNKEELTIYRYKIQMIDRKVEDIRPIDIKRLRTWVRMWNFGDQPSKWPTIWLEIYCSGCERRLFEFEQDLNNPDGRTDHELEDCLVTSRYERFLDERRCEREGISCPKCYTFLSRRRSDNTSSEASSVSDPTGEGASSPSLDSSVSGTKVPVRQEIRLTPADFIIYSF